MAKIAILGTGAWGTALANILLENNHHVYMWGVDSKEIDDLKQQRNTKYYKNNKLIKKPDMASLNLTEILLQRPIFFIIATPSIYIRETLIKLSKHLNYKAYFINVSKGLDPITNDIWSKTIKKILGNKNKGLVTLIGPSFAVETFRQQPTMINSVSVSIPLARMVSLLFNNNHFKCIEIKDEIGAEIIGALKNVTAIGMGIAYQLHTSINTRAAMLAQCTKEIGNLVTIYGGETKTITQFCGIGDIYLTCTDEKSRNFSFGKLVADVGIKKALEHNQKTIEGFYATKVIAKVIREKHINSPVFNEIFQVLFKNKSTSSFVKNIMKIIIE
ncbi:MAG: NAD(P)H-dependent glycerol-3-phosphate dehydrogenase [Mycoplasmataceae bacterium]|nr:NAD(P)H-dependent glycerol-3-phosphate dehydrogenase [Mycoplasmataceae bacterium]